MDFNLDEIRISLQHAPGVVSQMARELPPNALLFREDAKAWNIFEVLCHLCEMEVVNWIPRATAILSGERTFPSFEREGGAERYQGWSAADLAAEFARLREKSLKQLDAFHITPPQLELTGIHPEFGEVPLRQLLATWATHDYAHLAQISRLLARYHGQRVGPWAQYFSLLRDRSKSRAE